MSAARDAERPAASGILSVTVPPVRGILSITADFKIHTSQAPPGYWRRFWYWALLGWRWERVA